MEKEINQIILCLETVRDGKYDWVKQYGSTYLNVAIDEIEKLKKELQ